ncbi:MULTISPECIES: class I SAM-dependent methyltransferase [unclassified Pseudomonas]|uniref:class I SAM-dependent methyltransferase n=1 Tax=unclassified Pseudomonas TaxID=196821 RepID=UPI0015AA455D|nr:MULTISPECIES: class I SAM-dependent methyltransferase [unclassified Pseudomonas]
MDGGFYRAFEDRYRGSRELITQRLEVYLPFLAPLKELYQDYPTLDLGCGRGELLELLGREGYTPSGVDLDDGMLEACRMLELPAHKDDALSALQKLPDNSLVAVTGFHIAEHVPFPVLQQLVAEALRVLRPAGLLILETPNAESVVVGTNSFYLDPSHQRPLPNLLLSFLTEYSGFAKFKIVRLQEVPALRDESSKIGLWEVLSGTSPDYSVVAQKQAPPELLAKFDPVFDAAYGVSLDQLAVRYDRALESRLSDIEDEMAKGRADYLKALGGIQSLQAEQLLVMQRYNNRMDVLQAELNISLGNAHNWYLRATAYEQQLEAMRSSTSWRITAPLRLIIRAIYWRFRSTRSPLSQVLRRGILHTRLWLARRPLIQHPFMAILNRCPWLLAKLRSLHQSTLNPDTAATASDPQHGVIDHAPLTLRGRTIESALREAMTKGQK